MKVLLGIALILVTGLLASHRAFGRAKLWGRQHFFYLTGEEFLLVGLALGPLATGVIDADTLRSLEPVVALGLGYVGFAFGMQFRRRDLALVPRGWMRASGLQVLVEVTVLGVPLYLGLAAVAGGGPHTGALALALVASAVGTSTSFLYLVDRRTYLGRTPLFQYMRFGAAFDDLWAVVLFGIAACWLRGPGPLGGGAGSTAQWLALTLAVGAGSGGLLILASRMGLDDAERLLFLLGVVLLSGGLSAHLGLSPVVSCVVAGGISANGSTESEVFHRLLLRIEKPLYLLMLVLAGAMWRVETGGLALVVAIYVAFRVLGKVAGGRVAATALLGRSAARGSFGFGLAAQSEMAVAFMVNLLMLHSDRVTALAVSAVFAAVVVNGLLGAAFYTAAARRTEP